MTSALRLGLVSRISETDLPASHSYTLAPGYPTPGSPILLRPSIAHPCKYGNINPFSIRYGFRPLLRDRLTLGRLTLPRKPWVFGEQVFHLFYRYSCQHNHFSAVQQTSQSTFTPAENAPLPDVIRQIRSFGSMLSPVTFSAQRH